MPTFDFVYYMGAPELKLFCKTHKDYLVHICEHDSAMVNVSIFHEIYIIQPNNLQVEFGYEMNLKTGEIPDLTKIKTNFEIFFEKEGVVKKHFIEDTIRLMDMLDMGPPKTPSFRTNEQLNDF